MKKIASFTIDHTRLKRGIYVSRKDPVGKDCVTTFDIRMKTPNLEPVLDIPAMHTIEHIGATFLRNHKKWAEKTLYFGPMGCRTGFYVLFKEDLESKYIVPVMKEMFRYISSYTSKIPGASPVECGNYLSQDLNMARYEAEKFLKEVLENIKKENLVYPK
jgi:S-ribosylhomocysteine lyase